MSTEHVRVCASYRWHREIWSLGQDKSCHHQLVACWFQSCFGDQWWTLAVSGWVQLIFALNAPVLNLLPGMKKLLVSSSQAAWRQREEMPVRSLSVNGLVWANDCNLCGNLLARNLPHTFSSLSRDACMNHESMRFVKGSWKVGNKHRTLKWPQLTRRRCNLNGSVVGLKPHWVKRHGTIE